MYTRSFSDRGISPPDGYDGTAIPVSERRYEPEEDADCNECQGEVPVHSEPRSKNIFSDLFGGSLGNLFGGFGGIKSLGLEEILIIIAALYLFFSKDGDKECGIMLFVLLFIT